MRSTKAYGDILAQELADIIHETVADIAGLTAIPLDDRVHKMLVSVQAGPGGAPCFAMYLDDSTTQPTGGLVLVPDDIKANSAWASNPTSLTGRYFLLTTGTPFGAMEFVNCAAASATGLRAATATVTTTSTATLLSGGKTELDKAPRQIVFTTAGGTASDAPATATIAGYDAAGNYQTETVNLAQTATTATSTKFYRGTGLAISFAAGDGTGATIAIGWGAKLGLLWMPKVRQGAVQIMAEFSGGSKVTNGSFVAPATDAPFGSYAPNASLDGSTDFVVVAEMG